MGRSVIASSGTQGPRALMVAQPVAVENTTTPATNHLSGDEVGTDFGVPGMADRDRISYLKSLRTLALSDVSSLDDKGAIVK